MLSIAFAVQKGRAAEGFPSFLVGCKGGLSFRGSTGVSNFAARFPLGIQIGPTYSIVNPGDPFPTRRVFIADANDGTPKTSGHTVDFRMNFLYDPKLRGPKAVYAYVGPRVSLFDGTFHYVGANEEFDITSTQWGLGFVLEDLFALSPRLDLTFAGGFDGYFDGPIHGQDTTYNPNDDNVNPKENFKYKDARNVVYTPLFQPTVMMGLS